MSFQASTAAVAAPRRQSFKAKLLQSSMPVFVTMIAGQFGVRCIAEGTEMKTDGKTIWYPAVDLDDEVLRDVVYGVIVHECGHVKYTDFNVVRDVAITGNMLRKTILNITEDGHLESRTFEEFPGFRLYLDKVINWLISHRMMRPVTEKESPADILTGYTLLRMRAYALKQEALVPMADASEAVARKVFPSGAITRLNIMIEEVKRITSTTEALDLADAILAMLKDEEQKARKPPPPPQQQKQDQQQQSSSDQDDDDQDGGGGSGSDADDADDQQGGGGGGSGGQSDKGDGQDSNQDGDQDGGGGGGGGSDAGDDTDADDQGSDGSGQGGDKADQDDADGSGGGGGSDADDSKDQGAGKDQKDQVKSGKGKPNQKDQGQQSKGSGQNGDSGQGSQQGSQDGDGQKDGSAAGDGNAPIDTAKADALADALNGTGGVSSRDTFGDLGKALGKEIRKAPHSALPGVAVEKQPYQNMDAGRAVLGRAQANSMRVRSQLIALVQAFKDEEASSSYVGRKLNARKVASILAGETRVFRRTQENILPNAAVHILIDRSSSMNAPTGSGTRMDVALGAAISLAAALEGIEGVSPAITAFPAGDGQINSGSMTGVYPIMRHGQRVKNAVSNFAISAGGGTPLAEAMWYCATQLAQQSEPRKVLMVVTDGEPNDVGSVRAVVERYLVSGFEVIGIGIQIAKVREIFPISAVINDPADLRGAMFDIVRKTMLGI